MQAVLEGKTSIPALEKSSAPILPNPVPPPALSSSKLPTEPGAPPIANVVPSKSQGPSVGLLVGVAAAFLVMGALLAVVLMKFIAH
jgi:hypothetical protein